MQEDRVEDEERMRIRFGVCGGCELFGGAIGVEDEKFRVEEEGNGVVELFGRVEVLLYWE